MDTSPPIELSNKLVAHFLAYGFLGKAFFEVPSIDLMETIKNEDLFSDWPLVSQNAVLNEGLEVLRQYVLQWDTNQFDDLKRDYARLFVGPNRLPAPPWESVYRSEEHLLFEEETLQVRAAYREYGFVVPGDYVQPDDHFGLEMSFIAHLCRIGLDALTNQQPHILDSTRLGLTTFFREHVCQWAEPFLADVLKNATTPYYKGIALRASGCITHSVSTWQIDLN